MIPSPDPTPSPTPEESTKTDCGGGGLCQELGGMCDACAEEPPTRCASVLAGSICPDDLCRNASEQTQCGAYVDDMLGESEWDTPEQDETWDYDES